MRGSRGGEMGEFSPPPPPFSEPPFFLLMHRPQTPQPGFGSFTLLQKFTPIAPSIKRPVFTVPNFHPYTICICYLY